MTNPVNVEVIVAKLIDFLRGSTDVFLRKQLVSQISQPLSASRLAISGSSPRSPPCSSSGATWSSQRWRTR